MEGEQPSRHKLNHSDVERNRRNKLKREIDELKEVELLYDSGLNPVDKLSVLKCGVDIMRHITDDLSPRLYFLTPDEVFSITSKMNNVLQIIVSLPELIIYFISDSTAAILGIESDALIGRRLTDLILSSNTEMVRKTLQLNEEDREVIDRLKDSEDPESIETNCLCRSLLLGFYVNRQKVSTERSEDALVASRLHPSRWYRFLHIKGSIQTCNQIDADTRDAGDRSIDGEQLVFAAYGFPLAASSLPERSFTLRLDFETLSITDASERVLEVLGYSREELIGNRVTDLMLPLEGELFETVVRDRRRNDTVYVYSQLRPKAQRLMKFQVKITSVRGLASTSRHTVFFVVSVWTQIGYNSECLEEMEVEAEQSEDIGREMPTLHRGRSEVDDGALYQPLFTLDDVEEEDEDMDAGDSSFEASCVAATHPALSAPRSSISSYSSGRSRRLSQESKQASLSKSQSTNSSKELFHLPDLSLGLDFLPSMMSLPSNESFSHLMSNGQPIIDLSAMSKDDLEMLANERLDDITVSRRDLKG